MVLRARAVKHEVADRREARKDVDDPNVDEHRQCVANGGADGRCGILTRRVED